MASHMQKRHRFSVNLSDEMVKDFLIWADEYEVDAGIIWMRECDAISGEFLHNACVVSCGTPDVLLMTKLRWGGHQ